MDVIYNAFRNLDTSCSIGPAEQHNQVQIFELNP